jgi:hypothetical protein
LLEASIAATNGAAILEQPAAPALGDGPVPEAAVTRGGVGASNVTVRTVSTGETTTTGQVTLLSVTFGGVLERSDVTYTVSRLTNANGTGTGDAIDPARVSLSVDQSEGSDGPFDGPAPGIEEAAGPPLDADGDGKYEDVNGDGETDFADVVDFAFALGATDQLTAGQRAAFNFDGDAGDEVTFGDVVSLAFAL